MHLAPYVGEIDNSSDVDVLAIVRGFDKRFDQNI